MKVTFTLLTVNESRLYLARHSYAVHFELKRPYRSKFVWFLFKILSMVENRLYYVKLIWRHCWVLVEVREGSGVLKRRGARMELSGVIYRQNLSWIFAHCFKNCNIFQKVSKWNRGRSFCVDLSKIVGERVVFPVWKIVADGVPA